MSIHHLQTERAVPITPTVHRAIGDELNAALERLQRAHGLTADQLVYATVAFAWGISKRAQWGSTKLAEYALRCWRKLDEHVGADAHGMIDPSQLRDR